MKNVTIGVLIGLASSAVCADSEWIPARQTELANEEWRQDSPGRYLDATLDMNADGIDDTAVVLTSPDRARSAIEICFGGPDGATCRLVAAAPGSADAMGIEPMEAGCHDYQSIDSDAAGQPGRACSNGEFLSYFRFASAGSFFSYDRESNTFQRYWDSD